MNSLCVQGRVCDGEHLDDLWPHGDPEQGPDYSMMYSMNSLCVQGRVVTGNTSMTSGLTVTLSRDQTTV